MKTLFRFLIVILIVASLLALLRYFINAGVFLDVFPEQSQAAEKITDIYDIQPFVEGDLPPLPVLTLPDVKPYSVRTIQQKIPDVSAGGVTVQKLETGYRKLRKQTANFGERQGRLDPLAIVIESGVYNLVSLKEAINNPELLLKRVSGEYVLLVPLVVGPNAALVVGQGDKLLLSVDKGALLASFGDVYITGAEVTGWNTKTDAAAEFVGKESFRPYITAWCGSHLYIGNSKLSSLGYDASKSYGLTYTSCADTLYHDDFPNAVGGTGWIVDSEFKDMYFGFYSYEAQDVVIAGNIYDENIVYGIDPHDRSSNLIVAYNTVRGTKEKHGIILSRDVSNSYIFKNTLEDNAGTGVMMDRNSHGNLIVANLSQRNKGDGFAFYESGKNVSAQNMSVHNQGVGLRIRNSVDVISWNDVLNYNGQAALQLYTQEMTGRNIEQDPYQKKVGAYLIEPEIVGNKRANFKLTNVDYLYVSRPRLYQSPDYYFSGDLKEDDQIYTEMMAHSGISLRKKVAD